MHAGVEPIENLPEIPGYEILRQIGAGGMGTVYVGRDVQLRRSVAIKFNKSPLSGASGPEQQQRFRREAQTMAQVDHPNLAQIFTLGEVGDVQYIVMELVEGESLHDLLERDQKLGEREALDFIRQAACGLAEAWRLNITHRDVKPENLLISRGGVVKVVDFGLARGADPLSGGFTVTQSGNVVGTIRYIAPERVDGQRGDFRSDIYALGLVLYRMITGSHAHDAESPAAMLMKHMRDPLPDVRASAPDVSDATVRLLEWMTAKNPEERPGSGPALLDAIDGALAAGGSLLPNSISVPGSPWDATVAAPVPGREPDEPELVSEPSIAPIEANKRKLPASARSEPEPGAATPAALEEPVAAPRPNARRRRGRWVMASLGLLSLALLVMWRAGEESAPPPSTAAANGGQVVGDPEERSTADSPSSDAPTHRLDDPVTDDPATSVVGDGSTEPWRPEPPPAGQQAPDGELHDALVAQLESASTGVLGLSLEASGWVVSDLATAVPRVRVTTDRVVYPLLFFLAPDGEVRMLHPNDAVVGSSPAFGPGVFEIPEGRSSPAVDRDSWRGTLYLFASTTPYERAGMLPGAQPSDGAMIYRSTVAIPGREATIAEDFVANLPTAAVTDLAALEVP